MAGRPNAEKFVEFQTGTPMCLADLVFSNFMISGSSAAPGLVPAPPLVAGAVLFLREDGVWAVAAPGTASVTNAMLATMAEATFKGRAAGAGAGAPQDLTASEATAILNIFVSASVGKKGLVPAPTTADVGKVLGAAGWEPGAGLVKLASGSVASSTSALSINLSSYTNYASLYVKVSKLRPITNSDSLQIRLSPDGVTYDTTGYNYAYTILADGGGLASVISAAANFIAIATAVGNSVHLGYTGQIDIQNQSDTSQYPRLTHLSYYLSGASGGVAVVGGGAREAQQATNGIQFFFSTSTIAGGTWQLYGYT